MPFDAIIIGGGHNGLVTAVYLAKEGKRVAVLERRLRGDGKSLAGAGQPRRGEVNFKLQSSSINSSKTKTYS